VNLETLQFAGGGSRQRSNHVVAEHPLVGRQSGPEASHFEARKVAGVDDLAGLEPVLVEHDHGVRRSSSAVRPGRITQILIAVDFR
jgi:hypothetical protein